VELKTKKTKKKTSLDQMMICAILRVVRVPEQTIQGHKGQKYDEYLMKGMDRCTMRSERKGETRKQFKEGKSGGQ